MDKTETYRKMCEKAEEIQALRREEKHKNTGKWKAGDYWTDIFRSGIFIVCDHTDAWADEPHYLHHPTECIWLPRQDQLQEMVEQLGGSYSRKNPVGKVGEFADFVYDEFFRPTQISDQPSMEQFWLAFYQKELYQKIWDGKGWIKNVVE